MSLIPLYDLSLPAASVRAAEATIKSGWLSSGVRVRQLESRLADLLKVRYAVATNSATSALVATLTALEVAGREVITTPFTFVATVESILQSGGRPVFADIDPHTLNIDPDEVARKITAKTAAILPVDMAGFPADYDDLGHLAGQHQLPLIVDASHSLGAAWRRKTMAQLGDAAIYSFHATKNLVCGEGGLVATRHKALADKVRLITRHGITATAFDRKHKKTWTYDVTDLGFKGSMSELHAAVGLGHLTQFQANQDRRARLAQRYLSNLADLEPYFSLPPTDRKAIPAWHLFVIKLHLTNWKIDRNRFIQLMAENGVECGVHFIPVYEFSYYRNMGGNASVLPNVAYAGRRVVTLPLYPSLKPAQVDRVCEVITRLAQTHGR